MLYNSRNKIFDIAAIQTSRQGNRELLNSGKYCYLFTQYPTRYFVNTNFYNVAFVNISCKVDAIDVMDAK